MIGICPYCYKGLLSLSSNTDNINLLVCDRFHEDKCRGCFYTHTYETLNERIISGRKVVTESNIRR